MQFLHFLINCILNVRLCWFSEPLFISKQFPTYTLKDYIYSTICFGTTHTDMNHTALTCVFFVVTKDLWLQLNVQNAKQ